MSHKSNPLPHRPSTASSETLEADLARIRDGLLTLMEIQGHNAKGLPTHLHPHDDADFRTAALGAFVELGELVNECQWKPWRNYLPPTLEEKTKILKEMADVLHFLPWLMNNLQARFCLTADDFARGFMEVAEENIRRFAGEVPGREPPPEVQWRMDGPCLPQTVAGYGVFHPIPCPDGRPDCAVAHYRADPMTPADVEYEGRADSC